MALGNIPISPGCRSIRAEVAFTDGQGVERVELMDAESISEFVGNLIPNIVDSIGDVALDAVDGGCSAGASPS